VVIEVGAIFFILPTKELKELNKKVAVIIKNGMIDVILPTNKFKKQIEKGSGHN